MIMALSCGLRCCLRWRLPRLPCRQPEKAGEAKVAAAAVKQQKKELLRLMDELEIKLPPELARKLMILSMKIASGYCAGASAVAVDEGDTEEEAG
jgi:hypothetical protein